MENNKPLKGEELENARIKYSSALSLHNSQGEIQWTRFSAILIINTLLIGLIGFAYSKDFNFTIFLKIAFLLIPIFGIYLCDLWYKISDRGFFWIDFWLISARELERNLPGGINPVTKGRDERDKLEEKSITKNAALSIIRSFKWIYIIIFIANAIFIVCNLSIFLLL